MILFNKIDQADYDSDFLDIIEKQFRQKAKEMKLPITNNVFIQFISAKENHNIDQFVTKLFSLFQDMTHAERLIQKR